MSEGAEQLTQMLFGETCAIMAKGEGTKANWTRIRLDEDGQEGWVDTKMIAPMKEDEYTSYRAAYASAAMVAMPMAFAVSENNGQTIPLTAGTKLTHYQSPITNEASSGRFEILGVGFRIDPSMVRVQPSVLSLQTLLETTRFFINVPYLWGGKNALGMDCSGFTQIIMSLFGRRLLRNAREQVTQGTVVERLQDAQAGDLVFFDHQSAMSNDQSPITHVGLVIDPERVIHCSGRVKVEKLDEKGIYSAERGMYTHHLVAIRRV